MKVLITRPRTQSISFGKALHAAGFEPIYFPVIEIRPIAPNPELDQALKNLAKYHWVVFTSANAVAVVFEHGSPQGSPLRVAAIGPKTAEALQKRNIEPDFIPEEYVAEAILPGLGDLQGKWVLLPCAEIARQALPEAIMKAGGIVHEIAVYKTLPTQPDAEGLAALKTGVDWITFTSPSAVQNFVEIVRQQKLDPFKLIRNPKIACIGPITEQAARKEGFEVNLSAEKYTTEGLIYALSNA